MLDFLDALCAALMQRDDATVRDLLGHPHARRLPREVREEAAAILRLDTRSFRAPTRALRYRWVVEQLLRHEPSFAARSQLDLPFHPALPPALADVPGLHLAWDEEEEVPAGGGWHHDDGPSRDEDDDRR